jgi:hypothetical protein
MQVQKYNNNNTRRVSIVDIHLKLHIEKILDHEKALIFHADFDKVYLRSIELV